MADFFTSDPHLRHANIIKYCNRPFANVDEMDNTLITNWNNKVSPGDTVYVLGDFCFHSEPGQFVSRLNGDIILIRGNHDHRKRKFEQVFKAVHDVYIYKPKNIVLCHYSMRDWPNKFHGAYHLFGHSHGTLVDVLPGSMDIGVDCHNFFPLSLDEVLVKLEQTKKGD